MDGVRGEVKDGEGVGVEQRGVGRRRVAGEQTVEIVGFFRGVEARGVARENLGRETRVVEVEGEGCAEVRGSGHEDEERADMEKG